MNVSVSDAKAQLTELVRRAEAGEEIVLTRHGREIVRLIAVTASPTLEQRRAVLDKVLKDSRTALPGPDAAHSADFLYDENGMPA